MQKTALGWVEMQRANLGPGDKVSEMGPHHINKRLRGF